MSKLRTVISKALRKSQIIWPKDEPIDVPDKIDLYKTEDAVSEAMYIAVVYERGNEYVFALEHRDEDPTAAPGLSLVAFLGSIKDAEEKYPTLMSRRRKIGFSEMPSDMHAALQRKLHETVDKGADVEMESVEVPTFIDDIDNITVPPAPDIATDEELDDEDEQLRIELIRQLSREHPEFEDRFQEMDHDTLNGVNNLVPEYDIDIVMAALSYWGDQEIGEIEKLFADEDEDVIRAAIECEIDVDSVFEAYAGRADDDAEFAENLLMDLGDIPRDFPHYIVIDWDSTAENIMQDYVGYDGIYFRIF
jgi:hypothetical protein